MTRQPLLQRLPLPVRFLLVLLALYLFLVGIGAMGSAFKAMGMRSPIASARCSSTTRTGTSSTSSLFARRCLRRVL